MNVKPLPIKLPPEATLNHLTRSDEDAERVTLPGPQYEPLVKTGVEGIVFIIA